MDLQKTKADLEAQRDLAMQNYHRATGAIAIIDTLLAEEAEPEKPKKP